MSMGMRWGYKGGFMKVWLSVDEDKAVYIHPVKPLIKDWELCWSGDGKGSYCDRTRIYACRKYVLQLLRGTGKRLPNVGSQDLVEIELTAK
jgi:hypothetical protein